MEVLIVINFVLGVLGLLTTGAGYIVPRYTTMVEIETDQAVGQRSSYLYVAGCINAILWAVYGAFPKDNVLMFIVNLLGVVMMIQYVCKFIRYCDEEEILGHLAFPITGGLSTIGILLYYASNIDQNVQFFSWVCGLSRFILGVLPLIKMPAAWRERNMRSMPSLLLSLIAFANAVIWIFFACTGHEVDGFILWPSVAGVLSAAIQVIFHIILREQNDLLEPLF